MAGGTASANKARTSERRSLALNLRKSGATYRAIAASVAERLGIPKYSESQAHRDVVAELQRIADRNSETATVVRALELERLDQYLLAIAKDIQQGDYGAIDRALKISERRCKILGIDAPIELKLQELVQSKLEQEFNLFFELIASDSEIPEPCKHRIIQHAINLDGRSAMAQQN